MPIKINHGAPGSFKTASAVWFDVVEALRQGRKVVTNVRNIADIAQFEDVLEEEFADNAEIIFIDTDTPQNKKVMGCWFHWVPFNAYILIDEAQYIYSKRLRIKPEDFTYNKDLPILPDESVISAIDDSLERPIEITTAFEKHRHYQWDMTLTTPNKKMLPDWILECVESCYFHRTKENVLPIPYFKRRISIRQHDPSTTGASLASCTSHYTQKIPVKVHELYKSTESGEYSKNTATKSPVSRFGLVFFGILSAIVLYFMFSSISTVTNSERFKKPSEKAKATNFEISKAVENIPSKSSSMAVIDERDSVLNQSQSKIIRNDVRKKEKKADNSKLKLPYSAFEIFVIGASKIGSKVSYFFSLIKEDGEKVTLSSKDFSDMGYVVKPISLKVALIRDLKAEKYIKVYSRPWSI